MGLPYNKISHLISYYFSSEKSTIFWKMFLWKILSLRIMLFALSNKAAVAHSYNCGRTKKRMYVSDTIAFHHTFYCLFKQSTVIHIKVYYSSFWISPTKKVNGKSRFGQKKKNLWCISSWCTNHVVLHCAI